MTQINDYKIQKYRTTCRTCKDLDEMVMQMERPLPKKYKAGTLMSVTNT